MKTYRIAAIPGDGIGTEVVSAGIEVLHALARREGSFQFKVDHFDWGGDYYKKHGRMMPENGRSLIRNHDAILFGSAGHPDIPDHITLWGLRLAICQPFDQYANVRPTRVLPGITSPLRSVKHKELDWVIVRGSRCARGEERRAATATLSSRYSRTYGRPRPPPARPVARIAALYQIPLIRTRGPIGAVRWT